MGFPSGCRRGGCGSLVTVSGRMISMKVRLGRRVTRLRRVSVDRPVVLYETVKVSVVGVVSGMSVVRGDGVRMVRYPLSNLFSEVIGSGILAG